MMIAVIREARRLNEIATLMERFAPKPPIVSDPAKTTKTNLILRNLNLPEKETFQNKKQANEI